MAWSWMVAGSGWTSPSQKDLTPRPLGSTWAVPHMVEEEEEAQADLGAIHATTTEGMTGVTTEVVTIAMTTGSITDRTGGDLRHRTTEGRTGLAPDHGLTLHVAIESPASLLLLFPKLRLGVFLIGLIDF